MKKYLIPFITAMLLFPVSAADFGVDTKGDVSATKYSDSDGSAESESTVSVIGWVRSTMELSSINFRGGMIYDSESGDTLPSMTVLNLTGYTGPYKRVMYSVGRIGSSDPSGLIGRTPMDGGAVRIRTGEISFLFNAGYTGFLFKEDTKIAVTPNDILQLADDDEVTGVPRILTTAVLGFPGFMGRHDLKLQMTGQFDMWDSSDGSFDSLHTQYLGMSLEGPLSPVFFYRLGAVMGTAGMGSGSVGVSGAGRASVSWLKPDMMSLCVTAGVSTATGDPDRSGYIDDDGSGQQFVPLVPQANGQVLEAALSNNLLGNLKISVKPTRTFLTELSLMPVYRLTDGPVNYAGSESAGFAGMETDLLVAYAPFSDVRFDIAGGIFAPSDNFADGYDSVKWGIKTSLTLKM